MGFKTDSTSDLDARDSSGTQSDDGNTTMSTEKGEDRQQSAWQTVRTYPALVWWAFFFAMSAVGWGFDVQVNGAVVAVPAFRRQFGYLYNGEPTIPAPWLSAFGVISSTGQFFGGFICSYVADRLGRKGGLALGIFLSCGGILGEVLSFSRVSFLISKFILGVGLGFYLTIGPLYCSEVSPIVLRGITTAGINLAIVIGQLLSNSAIKGFGNRDDTWAFRGPFAIQFFFIAIGLPFAVESPWYLVHRGDLDGARHALQRLYGRHTDIEPKLKELRATVAEYDAFQQGKWVDCFRGTNLIRTGISTGVFVCQHFSGIIFVLGYSTYFFELAGLSTTPAFDLGVGITGFGVLGTVVSWSLVNSCGRRKLFLFGMAGLTVCLMLIGILDVIPTNGAAWVQASFTVVYALIYQSTIGAMAFVLLGEVSSPRLRAKTTALATATQSVFGIAMNVAVPYMVNPDAANMKGKVGFVFGGLSFLAAIGAFLYVPELKARSFEEIDLLFSLRVPPRKMGSYNTATM
ncbi:hypothetical protein Egran_00897 [Elaphomyces granulatus]|uniref:Major facilitator superfamily (MFS) profile domain-containing protein n=1 Tax=Elaphomyces granulatus TaxID=519963 RepID=A0A232M4L8_9EURO|nr:hypothetical protein Egran_00897 [Elaphomyces granulatus]